MHRPTLDRAGPDQRDLDHQVVELPRLQPGQGADLGPALHLEHPDRVGPAEHVVHPGLLLGQRLQRPGLAEPGGHEIQRVLHRAEDPQPQEVELDQPHPGAAVLVPLQHRAGVHPPALDRAHLAHRSLGQHHPAGVDAQVPRRPQQLVGELDHRRRDVVLVLHRDGAPGVDLLGPGVLLTDGVAERLGHVADRRLGPVADHVGHLRGVAPAVPAVDLLDHLLASVGVEVDVDVGLFVTGRGQEPLERQTVEDRVDGGDVEHVADHRVGRRSPALAEDPAFPGEVDHVVHDQEVAREVLLLDHRELSLQPLVRRSRAGPDKLFQPRVGISSRSQLFGVSRGGTSAWAVAAWPASG